MPKITDPAALQHLNSGPAPGAVPIGGPDPRIPLQTQKLRAEVAASQFAAPKAAADTTSAQADARFAVQTAEAQARKAEADARLAETQANSGNAKASAAVRADAINGYRSAQQLYGIIDNLNKKFMAGPGQTHGVQGLQDYMPYTANQQFDTAANAARGIVGTALGFTGGQLNTGRESAMNIGPYLPQAGDRDEVIKDKIKTLSDLAKNAESKSIQVLGGRPDENGNIVPIKPDEPAPQLPDDTFSQATGGTRTEVDQFRKSVMGQASQMITQGRPRSEVEKYVRDNGLEPKGFDKVYQFRNSPDFNRWQRQNPGVILPLDPDSYTRKVPMSALRQNFNKAAATDVGGAAASYGAMAANALTGNRLDGLAENLGGNPQEVNTGLAMLRQNHPTASMLGDASGQMMFDALTRRVPGLGWMGKTKLGDVALDAGYGGYAGQGDGNTLGGVASNVGGGLLGRGVSRLGGGAIRGAQSASAKYLDKAGVPMTIGQIARGSDSILGKGMAWTEDRLAGLPFADAFVNSARRRGEVGFNRAAYKEAGGSGLTGAKGVDELGDKVDNAYSFLDSASLPLDAPFAGSQAGVRASLPGLPSFGDEVGKSMDQIDRVSSGGNILGRDWQSAVRSARANRSSLSGQPFADDAANALGDVEDNLLTLAERQGGPGTVGALTDANRLNGQYQTILGALDNGPSQARGELFSPSRLDAASRQGARNYGGRAASMKGNRPFYELNKAGMDIMPNQVPDSGTSGRMMLAGLLLPSVLGSGAGAVYGGLSDDSTVADGAKEGGMIGGGFGTALPLALLGGAYSKTGQKMLQRALLGDRGPFANRAADAVSSQFTQSKLGPVAAALLRRIYLNDPSPQPGY